VKTKDALMTVPRTLAADASGADRALQFVVVEGDAVTVHGLPARGSVLVGRVVDVDVQVADPSASARHARIHSKDGAVLIEDVSSRNGTEVRELRPERVRGALSSQFDPAFSRSRGRSSRPVPRPRSAGS
jgi:hypothetical protein